MVCRYEKFNVRTSEKLYNFHIYCTEYRMLCYRIWPLLVINCINASNGWLSSRSVQPYFKCKWFICSLNIYRFFFIRRGLYVIKSIIRPYLCVVDLTHWSLYEASYSHLQLFVSSLWRSIYFEIRKNHTFYYLKNMFFQSVHFSNTI